MQAAKRDCCWGGLIDEMIEAPRLSGTQKTREYFWGFFATCVGVY